MCTKYYDCVLGLQHCTLGIVTVVCWASGFSGVVYCVLCTKSLGIRALCIRHDLQGHRKLGTQVQNVMLDLS